MHLGDVGREIFMRAIVDSCKEEFDLPAGFYQNTDKLVIERIEQGLRSLSLEPKAFYGFYQQKQSLEQQIRDQSQGVRYETWRCGVLGPPADTSYLDSQLAACERGMQRYLAQFTKDPVKHHVYSNFIAMDFSVFAKLLLGNLTADEMEIFHANFKGEYPGSQVHAQQVTKFIMAMNSSFYKEFSGTIMNTLTKGSPSTKLASVAVSAAESKGDAKGVGLPTARVESKSSSSAGAEADGRVSAGAAGARAPVAVPVVCGGGTKGEQQVSASDSDGLRRKVKGKDSDVGLETTAQRFEHRG